MNSRSTSNNPLRPMDMNNFGAQPAARTSSRLQNTQKSALGNGTGWGFGLPSQGAGGGFGALGGAPGLGGPARPLSGFAQVMGGGSGQGPIDMSDFPSLSGGQPQPGNNAAAAAAWNNNSAVRQAVPPQPQQQPAVQRPQQQPRAPSAAPSQHSIEQSYDGIRSQEATASRGTSDNEFPPLGGQNGFSNGLQSPEGSQSQMNGQQLPFRDATQQAPIGQPPTQQQSAQPSSQRNGFGAPFSDSPLSSTAPQPLPQQAQSGPSSQPNIKRYADMDENQKWGLDGLLAAFEARKQAEQGGEVDQTLPPGMRSSIFMGMDLNSLGMDLDSPDPLYPTFTPFPAATGQGPSYDFHDRHVIPDFSLPSAYQVNNVPPEASRMGAFSDESLFNIFYQKPRDVLQELAATELAGRDWRWHKTLRQWLQKDTRENNASSALAIVDLTHGAPVGLQPARISDTSERGIYLFFDAMNYRRERREFTLNYDELDQRHGGTIPPLSGMGGGMGLGGANPSANM